MQELLIARADSPARLFASFAEDAAATVANLDGPARRMAEAVGFEGREGELLLLPGPDGALFGALLGLGARDRSARRRYHLAQAVSRLPAREWELAALPDGLDPLVEALGWQLAGYRFSRKAASGGEGPARPRLVVPAGLDRERLLALARAETLARDLVNRPAGDLGPGELAAETIALAHRHGAEARVIEGAELAEGFPLIAAVGAASPRRPRLIELSRPGSGPRVTVVGKGICFDTGGLDLKPSRAMRLMKKDMGGAAAALALADAVWALGLPVALRVLIPAAENAVGGAAFRPGDILTARNGLTVEIGNTDAEGRLVLADALAWAAEAEPDLLLSIATLTGAARVALGADLVPFYTDDDRLAATLEAAGRQLADPLWRMPLWPPYETLIEPEIADLDNAPEGGFAGSITAALFLRRFARGARRFAHFDIYAWQPRAEPGRPRGGAWQAGRALLGTLEELTA